MTIPVAIYCRVSTETQQEHGYSLPEQKEICVKYGKDKNYEVVSTVLDDISGATFDRPGMNEVLALAKQNKIKRVLVQELDRFARDMAALVILERQLDQYGVKVDYILNNFQAGAVGDLHKNITVAIAQFEREQIKLRTKRGKMGKAKEGKVIPGPTAKYGYNYAAGEYLINEDEARIVRQVFEWYTVEKVGLSIITQRLTDMRIPTKRDKQGGKLGNKKDRPYGVWNTGTVADMIKSECYTGRMAFNKSAIVNKKQVPRDESEWVWLEIPAIISTSVFEAAQKQIQANRKFSKRNTKREYLLSGMMVCAKCSYGFIGFAQTNRDYQYYRCGDQSIASRGPLPKAGCTTYLRSDEMDDLIWTTICNLLDNPDLILEAIRQRKDHHSEAAALLLNRQEICEQEIKKIEQDERRLLDLYLDSKVPKELLDSRIEELRKRKVNFQAQLIELEKQELETSIDEDGVKALLYYCAAMREGLKLMNFEERRDVLKLLQVKVIVHERKPLNVTLSGLLPSVNVSFESPSSTPYRTKCYRFSLQLTS